MSAFGVKFIIIEMDLGKTYPEDELRAMYKAHYRAILPEHLYRRAIKE